MNKIIKIAPLAGKEDKLRDIAEHIKAVKNTLAEVVEEYEADGASTEKIDALTEALDALEDAFEAVDEVVLEEV